MSRSVPHHGRGVYGRFPAAVNRPAALLGVVLAAGGCAGPPAGPPPYPIAIRYSVESLATNPDHDIEAVVDQDFAYLRRLGFTSVFLRHVRDEHSAILLQAAADHGLAPAVAPRDLVYYVRTGQLPEGCDTLTALVRAAARNRPAGGDPPVIWMLGEAVDDRTAGRIARLGRAVRAAAPSVATAATLADPAVTAAELRRWVTLVARPDTAASPPPGGGDMLLLECVEREDETSGRPGTRWLASYHTALAQGLTGGLLVDRFRVVPGRWKGLVEGRDAASVARAAAIRRITARAARWGPRLRRLEASPLELLDSADSELRAVLFADARRRFVMLVNPSSTAFVHDRAALPADLAGRPSARAVLVPQDTHVLGAELVPARGGRLLIPLDLAPGDAVLWEIF